IAAADESIRLNNQFCLHRRRLPDPGGNEVVQLIILLCHRLNALAIARTDQSRHVERAHASPRLVTQPVYKWLEPTSKLIFPIQSPDNHGRPLQKPTTYESTEKLIWESCAAQKSAKVVLGRVLIESRLMTAT